MGKLRRPPEVDHVPPEDQAVLEVSPDARDARAIGRRIGRVAALRPNDPIRGKQRPEYEGSGRLALAMEPVLESETVKRLAKALTGKQPVFDQFTDHYRVQPNASSVDAYCESGNRKRQVKRDEDPQKQQDILNAMRRQTHAIADGLVNNTYDDLMTARMRRESLRTTQYLIRTNRPLDRQAALTAADAIQDFGHVVMTKPDIAREVGDEDIGYRIVNIGLQAVDNPEVLLQNADLLRLVQREQRARVEYWQPRHDFYLDYLGDRLTVKTKLDAAQNEAEISRLTVIREM